jgi:hypothetical protein
MSSSEEPDLSRAALRAARSPAMIASLLVRWERTFGEQPAVFLAASSASMTSLALCTRPKPESWGADVVDLAAACNIDATRLSAFLRQAISVERLASAPALDGIFDGRLLAARDKTDDEK